MDINYQFLCYFASEDSNGMTYAHAIFDFLEFKEFPVTWPNTCYVINMKFGQNDVRKPHKLSLDFLGPKNQNVIEPAEIKFAVTEERYLTFRIQFKPITFEEPGFYALKIAVNGRQEKGILLPVKKN